MESQIIPKLALRAAFLLILLVPVAIGAPVRLPHTHSPTPAVTEEAESTPVDFAAAVNPETPEGAQLLDQQELAEFAALDEEPGDEVIGGALSNQHLTYIVIALAAAVVVLVLK